MFVWGVCVCWTRDGRSARVVDSRAYGVVVTFLPRTQARKEGRGCPGTAGSRALAQTPSFVLFLFILSNSFYREREVLSVL